MNEERLRVDEVEVDLPADGAIEVDVAANARFVCADLAIDDRRANRRRQRRGARQAEDRKIVSNPRPAEIQVAQDMAVACKNAPSDPGILRIHGPAEQGRSQFVDRLHPRIVGKPRFEPVADIAIDAQVPGNRSVLQVDRCPAPLARPGPIGNARATQIDVSADVGGLQRDRAVRTQPLHLQRSGKLEMLCGDWGRLAGFVLERVWVQSSPSKAQSSADVRSSKRDAAVGIEGPEIERAVDAQFIELDGTVRVLDKAKALCRYPADAVLHPEFRDAQRAHRARPTTVDAPLDLPAGQAHGRNEGDSRKDQVTGNPDRGFELDLRADLLTGCRELEVAHHPGARGSERSAPVPGGKEPEQVCQLVAFMSAARTDDAQEGTHDAAARRAEPRILQQCGKRGRPDGHLVGQRVHARGKDRDPTMPGLHEDRWKIGRDPSAVVVDHLHRGLAPLRAFGLCEGELDLPAKHGPSEHQDQASLVVVDRSRTKDPPGPLNRLREIPDRVVELLEARGDRPLVEQLGVDAVISGHERANRRSGRADPGATPGAVEKQKRRLTVIEPARGAGLLVRAEQEGAEEFEIRGGAHMHEHLPVAAQVDAHPRVELLDRARQPVQRDQIVRAVPKEEAPALQSHEIDVDRQADLDQFVDELAALDRLAFGTGSQAPVERQLERVDLDLSGLDLELQRHPDTVRHERPESPPAIVVERTPVARDDVPPLNGRHLLVLPAARGRVFAAGPGSVNRPDSGGRPTAYTSTRSMPPALAAAT